MGLIRRALQNPYLVVVALLGIVVVGAFSFTKIPADLLPIYKTPAVQIVTLYPGMPPEVVERDIMSRLQRWTGQSVGIAHQEAKAMQGVCIVKDFFNEDIDDATAMSQVTSLAMSDLYYLPPGTLPPMVMPFDPTASVPLCLLSVSSEILTEKELYDIAYYEMRNRLQAIRGVIAPAVYGGVLRRILAYVDRDKLEARGLSTMDVVRAVQDANPFVPTGSAKLGEYDYLVLSNAMVHDVSELDDIPIRVDEAGIVYLRDVAKAEDSSQIQSNIVRINGRRQVYIPIYRQPGANTLAIVEEVRSKAERILGRIRDSAPEDTPDKYDDLLMDVVMDQSVGVRNSINSLTRNALFGAALVALVVLLFLGSLRSTFIVLVAIPMGVLGAGIGLYFTGDTINTMTLGGLALAIGILVDQAIVVIESITRHLALGKSRVRAALDGAQEVALPILVSTLTFIVVFFPVVFLTGMARYLFTPLALAVTFAVVTSYLVAIAFIPVAAARFLKAPKVREKAGLFDRVAKGYRWLAGLCVKFAPVVLVVAGLLLAGTWKALGELGSELFPRVDSGQFTMLVRAPVGTRLEKTEELVTQVEQTVKEVLGNWDPTGTQPDSDLALLISNIGVLYDWPAAYTFNNGPMDAFVLCQLKDTRSITAQEAVTRVRAAVNERFPGIEFAFYSGGMLTAALNLGLPAPIDIQIQGSKLEVSHEIARAIVREVKAIDGTYDVRIEQPLEYPAVDVQVDRVKAAELNLTQGDVIRNVAAALNSSVSFAPSFWIDPNNGNHYSIGAQYPIENIRSFETIENIPITGPNSNGSVLLKNIATLSRTSSPAVVKHVNITRTVDVFVNVEGRDIGSVAEEIEAALAASPTLRDLMVTQGYEGRGYRYSVQGEVQTLRESFGQFRTGLAIAALLVFLVLVAQLRSFMLPLVIFLTVPLGLIGVVGALRITNTPLSIPAFMGIILMVGLVVEYSILLVDHAAHAQRGGTPLKDALLDACEARLRPLLMTSLTTAFALLPMAMGLGEGAEANVPLARAIIGAVVGGAFLTLFVVPALYSLLGRFVPSAEHDAQRELELSETV